MIGLNCVVRVFELLKGFKLKLLKKKGPVSLVDRNETKTTNSEGNNSEKGETERIVSRL